MNIEISKQAETICETLLLSNYEKGKALRRLIILKVDKEDLIYDYLCLNCPEILSYFVDFNENDKKLFKKAPPGRSASEWTVEDLINLYK